MLGRTEILYFLSNYNCFKLNVLLQNINKSLFDILIEVKTSFSDVNTDFTTNYRDMRLLTMISSTLVPETTLFSFLRHLLHPLPNKCNRIG